MGVEFTIICNQHKEGLIIGKIGEVMYPGNYFSKAHPFKFEMMPLKITDERYQPLYGRVQSLVRLFSERHPVCSLEIATDVDPKTGNWPWGEGYSYWPRIAGGVKSPSGWKIFHVHEDVEYVKLFHIRPEIVEDELKRGKVDLTKVLKELASD